MYIVITLVLLATLVLSVLSLRAARAAATQIASLQTESEFHHDTLRGILEYQAAVSSDQSWRAKHLVNMLTAAVQHILPEDELASRGLKELPPAIPMAHRDDF